MISTKPLFDPELVSRIQVDNDPVTGLAVFGIEVNDFFISNLCLSECGRFEVDPRENYDAQTGWATALTWLNETLALAVEEALNAGCATIQERLCVVDGDYAGSFYSDDEKKRGVQASLATYLLRISANVTGHFG